MRTLLLPLLSTLLITVACGGAAADEAPADGAPSNATRVPAVHRASATSCTGARPDTQPTSPSPRSSCTKNEDCTAGKNGRCTLPSSGDAAYACTYDTCVSDADCGGGVCACDLGSVSIDACIMGGDCRTDADCDGGKGHCSPSQLGGCGLSGYFCHRPTDTCVDDGDCGAAGHCAYDKTAAHWACSTTGCD